MLVAILGDVAHAGNAALADGVLGDIPAAERKLAGLDRFKAGDAVNELGLAVAVDAGDADDLARAHRKAHVLYSVVFMYAGSNRQIFHVQHHIAEMLLALFHMEIDVAADHHGAELFHRGVFGFNRPDVLASAQHGAAIRHRHDLVELVGNKENALSLRGEIAHDLHQLFDLLRREHGRRLVEDEDLVVAVEHFQNLGALLHTDGDILDLRVGIDVQAVFLAQSENLFARFLLLKETELVRLNAHNDVIQNGEALHQLEVLMHHADAERIGVVGVVDLDFFAVLFDDALLRLIEAEQNAHQRGLARAVLPQQRMDLALFQLQGDIVVGDDPGESLGDVQHLDCVGFQIMPSFRFHSPPASDGADGNGNYTVLIILCRRV